MARITIRLSDRMAAQLRATAEAQNVTVARYVRRLISEGVAGTRVPHLAKPQRRSCLSLGREGSRRQVSAIRSLLARTERAGDSSEDAIGILTELLAERA